MTRSQRRAHRIILTTLAIFLPIAFAIALLSR